MAITLLTKDEGKDVAINADAAMSNCAERTSGMSWGGGDGSGGACFLKRPSACI